jgi:hypothetical protein
MHDSDESLLEEVRNVVRAVARPTLSARAGTLVVPGARLQSPRPK